MHSKPTSPSTRLRLLLAHPVVVSLSLWLDERAHLHSVTRISAMNKIHLQASPRSQHANCDLKQSKSKKQNEQHVPSRRTKATTSANDAVQAVSVPPAFSSYSSLSLVVQARSYVHHEEENAQNAATEEGPFHSKKLTLFRTRTMTSTWNFEAVAVAAASRKGVACLENASASFDSTVDAGTVTETRL